MKVTDKSNVVLLRDGSNAIESHTFVNRDTVRSTTCHLTDDAIALSSRPETRRSTCGMNDLPGRLQIGNNILSEVFWLQHRRRSIIHGNDIAPNHVGVDMGGTRTHLTGIAKKLGGLIRITQEIGK